VTAAVASCRLRNITDSGLESLAVNFQNTPEAAERARASGQSSVRHVAIIMDGNGRWAKERGLPRALGHRAGVEAVRRTVRAASGLGIPYLTLYSFSSENWSRPAEEISDLMGLMKRFIRRDLAELHRNNVKIVIIGQRDRVDAEMLSMLDEAQVLTANNTALTLVIAFNYGARTEITEAVKHIAAGAAAGKIDPASITPDMVKQYLNTGNIPDPDLLIRTSGEMRLSNFLLWQLSYAEIYITKKLWPDFRKTDFVKAVQEYQSRERRFGDVKA
jgi:undecaprenyl diphosphate synthase